MKTKIPQSAKKLAKENAIKKYSLGNGEFYETSAEQAYIDGFIAAIKFESIETNPPTVENGYADKIILIASEDLRVIDIAKFSSNKNKFLYSTLFMSKQPKYWRPITFL
jgi:hypothetical protein